MTRKKIHGIGYAWALSRTISSKQQDIGTSDWNARGADVFSYGENYLLTPYSLTLKTRSS